MRQLAMALLAAATIVAACSTDDDAGVLDATEPTAAPTAPGAPPTDPAGPDVPSTATPGDPGAPQAPAPPASPSTGPGAPAGPPPTQAMVASPAPAPGPVGAFAAFYLRPAESRRIVVDVRSQAGAEPRQRTITHLQQVLGSVSAKPVEIAGGEVGGSARQWTAAEIRALADAGPDQSRDRAVVHLYFLRGGFAESDSVLGVAVRSDVAAIFSDRVDEAAGLVSDPARIEDAVTVHEAGHLLGLVDLVLDTGRQDPEHPGHSRNTGSVMYYAVESTLVGSILGGGPPTEFDQADLDDLAAIRTS